MCRYATPFGLTSEYAHPAEILFLGFATIIGPAITGPHLMTLWLWMVLRVLETVEAHCGYHFPCSLSNFIPLYGGWVFILADILNWSYMFCVHSYCCFWLWFHKFCSADFHDYHHRLLYTKSGNYSSTFVYMDWWVFGLCCLEHYYYFCRMVGMYAILIVILLMNHLNLEAALAW